MAQFTVREVQNRLASLAPIYGEEFPLAALAAEARGDGQYVKVAFLGGNGCGKSSMSDMLVGGMLPTEEREEGELGEDEGPAVARPLLELAGDQTVEEAVGEGKFWRRLNPEPQGHPDHLADATAAFKGYYTFQRTQEFGKLSYLLPIGQPAGSTTQNDVQVSYDPVPSCTIFVRTRDKLLDMELECLEKMEQVIAALLEQEEDEEDALQDEDFTDAAALLKSLTGTDVVELSESSPSMQAVLERVKADQERQGTLLLPALAELARSLKHLHLQGAQQNLSSDIWFLRDSLANPVGALLREAGVQLADLELPVELKEDEGRTLQGLLVDYMHVTVPAPALGSVMLIDKPGLDDCRPLVKYNIAARLIEADHILLVTNKSLKEDESVVKFLARTSPWMTAQLAADNPHGSLTVVRYYEKVAPNAQLQRLYNGIEDRDAATSSESSHAALLKWLKKGPSLPTMERGERNARIQRFLESNCSFISLFPATFLSIALELASDVCKELQEHKVQLPHGHNQQEVVKDLMIKTRMHELLMRLGKLSSFRDLQTIDRLKAAVEAAQGAASLSGAADNVEEAGGAGSAAQVAAPSADELQRRRGLWEGLLEQLEQLTSRPNLANSYVLSAKIVRHESGSWADVQAELSGVLDQMRLAAVEQCQGWLADARIAKAAVQAVKSDERLGLSRLRAILKRDLFRKRRGRPGLVEHIETELSQIVENVVQQRAEALYAAHAAAAERVAGLLRDELGRSLDLQRLEAEESDWWPRFWDQQLVSRIKAELRRAAQDVLIDPSAEDSVMMSRLSRLLRLKMGPKLRALERDIPKPARPDCWVQVEAAIMDALGEVGAELHDELDTMFRQDYLEQAVSVPFFQEVRKMNHLIAVVEMRPEQLAGPPRQQRLVARRAAQPCLWRCIFRFLSAMRGAAQQKCAQAEAAVAAAAAAAQGAAEQQAEAQRQAEAQAERQELQEQLLQELAEISTQLVDLADVYRGPHQAERQQRLGNGLAQKMLQSARQLQVDALLHARRNGIRISEVYVVEETLQFEGFAACRGVMAVPAAEEDSMGSLQTLLNRVAGRSLYCASVVPGFHTGSALEAAYIAIYRDRMTKPYLRHVLDMVAFEMECNLDRLKQDLRKLVPQHDELGTAAYLEDLVAGRWWTSLLELQWLALVLRVNFIVFSTLPSPGSRSGRMTAYYIQHKRDMRIGGPMHTINAYPLAVCLRRHEGGVRPWFLALKHKPETTEAAKEGRLRAPCPINSSRGLQGTPEQVCQVLEDMTTRAALARGSPARPPPRAAAAGPPAVKRQRR